MLSDWAVAYAQFASVRLLRRREPRREVEWQAFLVRRGERDSGRVGPDRQHHAGNGVLWREAGGASHVEQRDLLLRRGPAGERADDLAGRGNFTVLRCGFSAVWRRARHREHLLAEL